MLKTAQMLLPLLGAATAALRFNPRASSLVIPQPEIPLPQGNWLNQQWQMIKAAVKAWVDDYAPSMGAALSYYTLFSLAPLLIIVIAVAGMVFGQEAAQGEIVAQLCGIMGEEGAVAVEGMLKAAREPAKVELELPRFDGHLIVMKEGVQDAQSKASISGAISPANDRFSRHWSKTQRARA